MNGNVLSFQASKKGLSDNKSMITPPQQKLLAKSKRSTSSGKSGLNTYFLKNSARGCLATRQILNIWLYSYPYGQVIIP
jgi:hypothetical protein